MKALWIRIREHEGMSKQLIDSRLIVQFNFREPEGQITIDCSDGQQMIITTGPTDVKPVIEMVMKSDVAHEFWMGRVSIPVAILTGKIVSKGPTPKAMALLPVIRPAFAIYPEVLEQHGKKTLVSS
jgi:hypothetical protein